MFCRDEGKSVVPQRGTRLTGVGEAETRLTSAAKATKKQVQYIVEVLLWGLLLLLGESKESGK